MTKAPKSGQGFRAVLAGLRHDLNFNYLLAPACLKAYADAQPGLARKVSITILQRSTSDDLSGIARDIASLRPNLAGFSCYLWNIEPVLHICRLLRIQAPEIKLILGGPEASPQAERLLLEHPEIDFVCVGEGEATFADLLSRLSSGGSPAGTAGLAWRKKGVPALEPARLPIADLDSIPSPLLLGLLPLTPGDNFILETSRGCPFKCAYCDWQNGQKTRYFSRERVISEAAFLLDRVPKVFVTLADSDIFMDLPRAKALISKLGPMLRGRNSLFTFLTYLPRLDNEALSLLDADQFQLGVGIQTVNGPALESVSRFFDRDRVEEAVSRMRRLAPRCRLALDLIYGLPGDDLSGFRRSLDWAISMEPELLSLQQALALPGADFGRHPEYYGITVEPGPPHRVTAAPTFPAVDIEAAGRLSVRVLALNEEKLFRWAAGRLKTLLGSGPLPIWEALCSCFEREVPEAGLGGLCASCASAPGDCGLPGAEWRRRLTLWNCLKLWRALEIASRGLLAENGLSREWPAFGRELRRRKLRLFLERALSGPGSAHCIRLLDHALNGTAGRFWQAFKLYIRRALQNGDA